VEIRVFSRPPDGPAVAAAGGGAGVGGVAGAAAGAAAGQPAERRFGLTDFVSLFRRRLGQQLWLMCKLAFMVGVFSSNNASWRRILVLCLAAAGIFCMDPLTLLFILPPLLDWISPFIIVSRSVSTAVLVLLVLYCLVLLVLQRLVL
jgi:hypothetical protein